MKTEEARARADDARRHVRRIMGCSKCRVLNEDAPSLCDAVDALAGEVETLRVALSNAEGDARILAHSYEHDSRPPPGVVERALAYRAGRPTTAEETKTP